MKIFIIAFACEPNRTSEPGVGWNIVGELSRVHDLTVLTRCNNRPAIENFLEDHAEDPRTSVHWEYFELPEWFHRLKKHLPGGVQLYQELWQYKVAQVYRRNFNMYDIVHHLTFGSIFFTPWAARHAKKFVWGPVGGAAGALENAFLKNERIKSFLTEAVYRGVAWYSFHPFPWARHCREACNAVLYRTSDLAARAIKYPNQITGVLGEAAYIGDIVQRQYQKAHHPLRVMSVGRLIPLKGIKYAVEGFDVFLKNGGEGELHIYGDGPLRAELENQAKSCSGRIVFHGNVPNCEILKALENADILVHASFREGVSWTILEAMSKGVPVVCQDRAGMKDVVSRNCGVKIAAQTPFELVEGIQSALQTFWKDENLIELVGRAAQCRIKEKYSWRGVADVISQVYRDVLDIKTKEP